MSSEKSRGSVGRSGSIGGRRPPSRPRSLAILPDEASLENSLSLEDLENQSNIFLTIYIYILENNEIFFYLLKKKKLKNNFYFR